MAQELSAAMKTAKDIERQLTVAENRLAYVQDECKRLGTTRDAQQAEIDRKTADYNIYISQRDTDSKRMRQDVLEERAQMDKDKVDFQALLIQFQKDKQGLEQVRHDFEVEKAKNVTQTENIRQFIIAVQRACSLLGL